MQVKGIPLPADAASRGMDWPVAGEPTAAELAAIEAELQPQADALDWDDWAEALAVEVDERAEAFAGFGGQVPAATLREWQELPTQELALMALAGNLDALDPLYRRYVHRMRGAALRRADYDQDRADEAVALTWAKVVARIGGWGERGVSTDDFEAWLFGTLKWSAVKIRPGGREIPTDTDVSLIGRGLLHEADAVPVGGSEQQQGMCAELHREIEKLGERPRAVVQLLLQGLSLAEAAARLGLSVDAVKHSWQAAQLTLRNRLGKSPDCSLEELARTDPAQLRAMVEALPGAQRTVALMRLFDRFGNTEIARRTGRSTTSVRGLWAKGRNNMRRMLNDPNQPAILRMLRTSNPDDTPRPADVRPIAAALGRRTRAATVTPAAARRQAEDVASIMDQLPPQAAQVVALRLEGLTIKQMAARTGRSEMVVSRDLRLARETYELANGLREAMSGERERRPSSSMPASQQTELMRAHLDQLTATQQQVARLRLDGMTYAAISKALGKTRSSVHQAWQDGLASLDTWQGQQVGRAA